MKRPKRPSLLAPLALLAGVCVVAAAVGTTGAAFSARTSNPTTFSAAATFATCEPYDHTWLTGMEHGLDSAAGEGVWATAIAAGAGAVDGAVKRSGAYSLRIAPTAGTAYRGRIFAPGVTDAVMSFSIRLDSLPSTDVPELGGATTTSSSSYASLRYVAATQQFAVGFPGQSVAGGPTVAAGQWYTIDLHLSVGTATHSIAWQIDGSPQPPATRADIPATVWGAGFGAGTPGTFVANYDDMAMVTDAAAFPIRAGSVLALRPNGAGTHSSPASFANDDGSAVDSTTPLRLADAMFGSTTSYVEQTSTGASAYVEVGFDDPAPTSCVRAVQAFMAFDATSNQPNHGATRIVDGADTTTVYDGPMRSSTPELLVKAAPVSAGASPWSAADLSAMRARLGYSTDANPAPRWQSLLVEYDAGS